MSKAKALEAHRKGIYQYLKRWVKGGGKLSIYVCQHCEAPILTYRPEKSMVSAKGFWDSCMLCPECGKLNFVKVYPSGKTKAIKLGIG